MNEETICQFARGYNGIRCDAPHVVKLVEMVTLIERQGQDGKNDIYDGLVHDLRIMCGDSAPCMVPSGTDNLMKRQVYAVQLQREKQDELMEVAEEE
jgi:hypothetical protein